MRIPRTFLIQAAGCLLAGLLTAAVYAQQSDTGKSLEILMETDGANFSGLSKKVSEGKRSERHRQVLRKGFYYIEALDAAGQVLRVQTMPASTDVLYDYFEPAVTDAGISVATSAVASAPQSGHGRSFKGGRLRQPKAQFLINMPYDAAMKTLKIHILKEIPAQNEKREYRISGAHQAAPAQAPSGKELKATLDLGAIPEEP